MKEPSRLGPTPSAASMLTAPPAIGTDEAVPLKVAAKEVSRR